jgi:hypothetical protein
MHWLLCTDYHSFIWYAGSYMFRYPCAIFMELLISVWVTWKAEMVMLLVMYCECWWPGALVVVVSCVTLSSWALSTATWPRWPKGTDHCSTEEYWCTHVDACVAKTWTSYRCVPCHPRCTHRTSLVVKKLFQFSCGCEKFHLVFLKKVGFALFIGHEGP